MENTNNNLEKDRQEAQQLEDGIAALQKHIAEKLFNQMKERQTNDT